MKKSVLAIAVLLCISAVSAQQKFGIATYTAPAGWQVSEGTSSVTLENNTKGAVCKISISSTQKGGVSTAAEYTRSRSSMSIANISYSMARGAITRNEADGMVSFSSYGTGVQNGVSFRNYFYSVSNGKQTYFVQLSASDNTCVGIFNDFLGSLLIDPVEDSNGATQARARKAAPAAPAAPAPMM